MTQPSSGSSRNDFDGKWKWVYVVPLMALMIPIIAITEIDFNAVLTSSLAAVVVGIGVGTMAARSLLKYRHQLRLKELRAQQELIALESRQLTEAQRLLDLDDTASQMRSMPQTEPPLEV